MRKVIVTLVVSLSVLGLFKNDLFLKGSLVVPKHFWNFEKSSTGPLKALKIICSFRLAGTLAEIAP